MDWGAPMAWGWPFLLRLAAAHRRRRERLVPPGTASGEAETPSLASLPSTGAQPTSVRRHIDPSEAPIVLMQVVSVKACILAPLQNTCIASLQWCVGVFLECGLDGPYLAVRSSPHLAC